MIRFSLLIFLILLLKLLPFYYSACFTNADQNKYEGCHYDAGNISNFIYIKESVNANISHCSFVNLQSKAVLESSVEVYVEYTV
jgi:hypothetical protein